jgi:hypothetical protein
MPAVLDPSLLKAYSRGEITRREIGQRHKEDISFGDLCSALLAHGLPLPRFPGHPDSPGVHRITRLAQLAPHAG